MGGAGEEMGRDSPVMGSSDGEAAWEPGRVRHQIEHCLGRGAFGAVFLGLDELTGEQVAAKQIVFPSSTSEERFRERLQMIMNEVGLMRKLCHPHIVRYLSACREGYTLWIYMEYVSGGTLTSLVRKFGGLPSHLAKKFLRHMLYGLEYLHELHICHRDIKGDNVLLTPGGEAKLCDFGTAKQIGDAMSLCGCLDTVCGTPNYMAPEVLTGERYGLPADVWSVGCTLFEMLTAKRPFSEFAHPQAAMFHLASSGKPPALPDTVEEQAGDFAEQCFVRDPRGRASAAELLLHPYAQAPLGATTTASRQGTNRQGTSRLASTAPGRTVPPPAAEIYPETVDPHQAQEEEGEVEEECEREEGEDRLASDSEEDSPLAHTERAPDSVLPTCDVCRAGRAVWGCQQCVCSDEGRRAPLRFCPMCWDRVHDDPCGAAHRKAPLLFGRGVAAAALGGPVQWEGSVSPSRRSIHSDPSPRRGDDFRNSRDIMLGEGRLVEMLSVTDMSHPAVPSESPASTPSALSPGAQPQWGCSKCTYLNHHLLPRCEICGSDRP
eukprot:Hpha_TRINITY_DN16085_c1_g6::TRINITY_DN16085_c1_g6_i1::g.118883::m.118883